MSIFTSEISFGASFQAAGEPRGAAASGALEPPRPLERPGGRRGARVRGVPRGLEGARQGRKGLETAPNRPFRAIFSHFRSVFHLFSSIFGAFLHDFSWISSDITCWMAREFGRGSCLALGSHGGGLRFSSESHRIHSYY